MPCRLKSQVKICYLDGGQLRLQPFQEPYGAFVGIAYALPVPDSVGWNSGIKLLPWACLAVCTQTLDSFLSGFALNDSDDGALTIWVLQPMDAIQTQGDAVLSVRISVGDQDGYVGYDMPSFEQL